MGHFISLSIRITSTKIHSKMGRFECWRSNKKEFSKFIW